MLPELIHFLILHNAVEMYLRFRIYLEKLEHVPTKTTRKVYYFHSARMRSVYLSIQLLAQIFNAVSYRMNRSLNNACTHPTSTNGFYRIYIACISGQ
jgi:hypothetical protein